MAQTERTSPETIDAQRSVAATSFYVFGAVIIAVYFGLAAGNALTALPWCDEAWLSNPALTFLRKGYFGTPILTEFGWGPPLNLLHIQQKTYWIMPLHMLAQAGWYRVFGFSLTSLRLLSVLFGGVLLIALGYLAYYLTGRRRVALLTMAIAGTDYFLLTRAADGRMDSMAAAFEVMALAAYAAYREKDLTRAVLLSGVFAALASFTHPEAGFFAVGGIAVFAICSDWKRIRLAHFAFFLVPFVVIGLCWSMYIVKDVPAFTAQMAGNAYGRWMGVTDPKWSFYGEFRYKYFKAFGLNSYHSVSLQNLRLIPLALYCCAIVAISLTPKLRRQSGVSALFRVLLFFVFGGMAFDGSKRWYYLTYVVPLFAVALAVWFNWLMDGRLSLRHTAIAAIVCLIAIQVSGTLYRIHKNDLRNSYGNAVKFVRTHDPEQALIYGSGELGFDLGFPDYLVDDISLGYYSGRAAKLIFVPKVDWERWMSEMPAHSQAVGKFEKSLLARDYTLAFSNPDYRIYQRNQ